MQDKVTWGRADFAGTWRVARQIADAHGGQAGRFEGRAELTPQGEAGLVYAEAGVLRMGAGPGLTATRTYLWAFEGPEVVVRFADGRPFHRFSPGGGAVQAEHLCGADLYHVAYDFAHWPDWQARWTVVGPRKDYAMLSRYCRETLA